MHVAQHVKYALRAGVDWGAFLIHTAKSLTHQGGHARALSWSLQHFLGLGLPEVDTLKWRFQFLTLQELESSVTPAHP